MSQKVKIEGYVPLEYAEKIAKLCEKNDRSRSYYVRKGVEKLLQEKGELDDE